MSRPDNSRHLLRAAQQRAALTRAKAVQALHTLHAEGRPISFEALAREAGVSRSWLYAQPDLRAEIERLRTGSPDPGQRQPTEADMASEASLRQRLEAANNRIRRLADENQELRRQLAYALGQRRREPRPTTIPEP